MKRNATSKHFLMLNMAATLASAPDTAVQDACNPGTHTNHMYYLTARTQSVGSNEAGQSASIFRQQSDNFRQLHL
ncbi:MAG: hypothetical protein K2P67_00125 [Gallionellaceae bacterium]|jgi:hypothetical protein|nr:hypothetical protein [Gallionellaceae bacterium]